MIRTIDLSTGVETQRDYTAEELEAIANSQQSDPKAEARAYLNSTDWYVIRFSETGEPIPEDVLQGRSAARLILP